MQYRRIKLQLSAWLPYMKCNSVFWIAFFQIDGQTSCWDFVRKSFAVWCGQHSPVWAPSRSLGCCRLQKRKERSSPTILGPWMESWSPWRLSDLRKKGLHPTFGDLKWKPGTLDGYVASPKITKRSSTIIRGIQMESGALRQLRESFTTLLWDLYDGPLKCSFMDSYTPMGLGQISPCNLQPPSYKPWMGGSCSVSFVSLTSVETIYSTVLEQIL